jgi:hypothetical protein
VAPVPQNRFEVSGALHRTEVGGSSTLFGAIREAIEMAGRAPAPERAIRGVVVLAGGLPTSGEQLSDLVKLASPEGRAITICRGFQRESACTDEVGQSVDRAKVSGVRLATNGAEGIKVYFVGVGMSEADLDVGRILADATHSSFVGTTTDDLATVIGVFKGYF